MSWIYQITPFMKKAEKLCNERGIYMELVIRNEPHKRIYLRYLDEDNDRLSPQPYVSKKDAEIVMYNHYLKICDKLKISL